MTGPLHMPIRIGRARSPIRLTVIERREGGEAGARRVILGGDRGAEQDHDAIAHAPDDHAAEPRHGLGDDADHGAQGIARVFRIHPGDQLRGAADVGEKNRDLFLLGAERVRPGRERTFFPVSRRRCRNWRRTGRSAGLWPNTSGMSFLFVRRSYRSTAPAVRSCPQRGQATSISPRDGSGSITGMGCRSRAGKPGRPPARSVATTRKRSGSRSAEACQPAQWRRWRRSTSSRMRPIRAQAWFSQFAHLDWMHGPARRKMRSG